MIIPFNISVIDPILILDFLFLFKYFRINTFTEFTFIILMI